MQYQPEGFKNGLVTNLERAAHSLEQLMGKLVPEQAKQGDQVLESPVYVVLGNPKLKTHTFSSSQYFHGMKRILSTQDVRSVVEQTQSVATLPLSEFILQTLPVSFLVNDLDDVSNPIGLEAQRLGVTLKIFSMDAQDFKNITRAFETAEIEVAAYFPKMLTASEAVLNEQEKQTGALLIDVASEMTSLAVWKKGELINTQILPIGGRHLSSQLANLWEIELQDAERVKEQYGSLEKNLQFEEELIPMVERNGKKAQPISRQAFQQKFLEISKIWFKQILTASEQFLREEKVYHPFYVFTGGGTCIDGFLEFLQREFSIEARLGLPHRIEARHELLVDPSLSAALGMYCWLSYSGNQKSQLLQPQGLFQKTFTVARDWFSNYF